MTRRQPEKPKSVSVSVSSRTEETKSITLTGVGVIETLRKAGYPIPDDRQISVDVQGVDRYGGNTDMISDGTTVVVSWKNVSTSEEEVP